MVSLLALTSSVVLIIGGGAQEQSVDYNCVDQTTDCKKYREYSCSNEVGVDMYFACISCDECKKHCHKLGYGYIDCQTSGYAAGKKRHNWLPGSKCNCFSVDHCTCRKVPKPKNCDYCTKQCRAQGYASASCKINGKTEWICSCKLASSLNCAQRNATVRRHNTYRSQLANGLVKGANQKVSFPTAKEMHKVAYSNDLEYTARVWVSNCKAFDNIRQRAPGRGHNLAWLPGNVKNITSALLRAADQWWSTKQYGLPKLEVQQGSKAWPFAQMAFTCHYQKKPLYCMLDGYTMKIGCAVQYCPAQKKTFVYCVYDKIFNFGEKIYRQGKPCKKPIDCPVPPQVKIQERCEYGLCYSGPTSPSC